MTLDRIKARIGAHAESLGLRTQLAESIGTFSFVFIGVLSIVLMAYQGWLDSPAALGLIAVAHGGAIAAMVTKFGEISGGHFNPAVTFGMMVARKIGIAKGLGYIAMQIVGAMLAAWLVDYFIASELGSGVEAVKLGVPAFSGAIPIKTGFFLEAIMTFFLVLMVFRAAVEQKFAWAGAFIGGMVALDVIIGGPLTGAAMNPARAFGPAVVAGYWAHHWIYWAAPFAGAAAAALANFAVTKRTKKQNSNL